VEWSEEVESELHALALGFMIATIIVAPAIPWTCNCLLLLGSLAFHYIPIPIPIPIYKCGVKETRYRTQEVPIYIPHIVHTHNSSFRPPREMCFSHYSHE